ncbi:GH3 family domain-containing protein [Sporocytophaga myxococcoides]|uniref:GH3 family domain-containing protein n=1 Tax=Sporocytophaga myxococcoides TaxID=153721 RepID=UPI00040BFB99|nr:GH3 auxin-responsive promoter family protein [Sporocytophaga myxococcoides]
MALFGAILNKGIKLGKKIESEQRSAFEMQKKELKKLLKKASETQFGEHYHFQRILQSFNNEGESFYTEYKKNVPVWNYNKLFNQWWHKSKAGERDVTWPGIVRYFALSSGTSEASTKHIPLTKDMIKSNKRTGIQQILSLSAYDLPSEVFEKEILMLGGSTELLKAGSYYEGDLSGIQASKIPLWFHLFYKPGRKIAKNRDWDKKLNEITENARNWDIGFVVGVPAWIQIMMERIIEYHKVKNIHEVWPNLKIFVHGGVSFEPYKKGFEKLLGKPLIYMETYLASEGFIAYQSVPNSKSMKLALDNGLFFEFVPFNEKNFNQDGDLVDNPETLMIHQIEEGIDYALLLSTNAGTWRYLIGDVIKLVSKAKSEIIITGRTKHFLSLCGEHLSVENMNKAIHQISEEFNIEIREFTVSGIEHESLFAHQWFIGTDQSVDHEQLKLRLDEHLKQLNDDYRVERGHALKDIFVKVIPSAVFYKWFKSKGKEGGQNKFPRVMKKALFDEWSKFVKQETENTH